MSHSIAILDGIEQIQSQLRPTINSIYHTLEYAANAQSPNTVGNFLAEFCGMGQDGTTAQASHTFGTQDLWAMAYAPIANKYFLWNKDAYYNVKMVSYDVATATFTSELSGATGYFDVTEDAAGAIWAVDANGSLYQRTATNTWTLKLTVTGGSLIRVYKPTNGVYLRTNAGIWYLLSNGTVTLSSDPGSGSGWNGNLTILGANNDQTGFRGNLTTFGSIYGKDTSAGTLSDPKYAGIYNTYTRLLAVRSTNDLVANVAGFGAQGTKTFKVVGQEFWYLVMWKEAATSYWHMEIYNSSQNKSQYLGRILFPRYIFNSVAGESLSVDATNPYYCTPVLAWWDSANNLLKIDSLGYVGKFDGTNNASGIHRTSIDATILV